MKKDFILILNDKNPHHQVLANTIRDCKAYSKVLPLNTDISEILKDKPAGIIISGEGNLEHKQELLSLEIPVLFTGSKALLASGSNANNEYEKHKINITEKTVGFLQNTNIKLNSKNVNRDFVKENELYAGDKTTPAIVKKKGEKIYYYFFNPETERDAGFRALDFFVNSVCKVKTEWTMEAFAREQIEIIKEKAAGKKVLLALSGGVDSSVVAALLSKAIGSQLTCIFVDTGLMRKNEGDEVEEAFKDSEMNFIRVEAEERFLSKLAGITEPEQKRKIIGEEFIRVFEEEAKKIGSVDFLAQGTIYPDIIESGTDEHAVVKSHHNVGGLPDHVDFKEIIEPLDTLFKNEVRELGKILGLPKPLVQRQPFPGPGLAIRVIGEVTKEKLDILRDADYIFRNEIRKANLSKSINQYFAVLTSIRSVGVTDNARTYDYTLALRAVTTHDFMSAKFAKIPYEVLEHISEKITNEVPHISRVVYDITSKPPATIEWE